MEVKMELMTQGRPTGKEKVMTANKLAAHHAELCAVHVNVDNDHGGNLEYAKAHAALCQAYKNLGMPRRFHKDLWFLHDLNKACELAEGHAWWVWPTSY